MKLHDMNALQLRDTLCRLVEPVCRILEDERTQEAIDALMPGDVGELPLAQGLAHLVGEMAPLLLQRHWNDVLMIASVLTDTGVEELRAGSGIALVAALTECLEEELAAFFPSAAGLVRKA